MTAVKLPEPTICGMACFYEPGHPGPHMRWLGADCDSEWCHKKATYRWGREVVCDDCLRERNMRVSMPLNEPPAVLPDQPIQEGSEGELLALREIVEIIMTQHWDLRACECWVCKAGRRATAKPREKFLPYTGSDAEAAKRPRVHVDDPSEGIEWTLRRR